MCSFEELKDLERALAEAEANLRTKQNDLFSELINRNNHIRKLVSRLAEIQNMNDMFSARDPDFRKMKRQEFEEAVEEYDRSDEKCHTIQSEYDRAHKNLNIAIAAIESYYRELDSP